MRPRLPQIRLIRPIRTIRATVSPRRPITTASFPPPKSFRIPVITGTIVLGLGAGLYTLSRPSHAETQSLKAMSDNGNRELESRATRKQSEKTGNLEKETTQSRRSTQDRKADRSRPSISPEIEASEDSETRKNKSGHDEKGQPKDDRVTGNSGETDADEEDEDEEHTGPQAIGMNFD